MAPPPHKNKKRSSGGKRSSVRAPTSTLVTAVPGSQPHVVREIGPNDVLLGRGAPTINYQGNVSFRALVRSRKAEYTATARHREKDEIARQVIEEIGRRHGRFLRRIETTVEAEALGLPDGRKSWIIADDSIAMEKVKQALRDRDPDEPNGGTVEDGNTTGANATVQGASPETQNLVLSYMGANMPLSSQTTASMPSWSPRTIAALSGGGHTPQHRLEPMLPVVVSSALSAQQQQVMLLQQHSTTIPRRHPTSTSSSTGLEQQYMDLLRLQQEQEHQRRQRQHASSNTVDAGLEQRYIELLRQQQQQGDLFQQLQRHRQQQQQQQDFLQQLPRTHHHHDLAQHQMSGTGLNSFQLNLGIEAAANSWTTSTSNVPSSMLRSAAGAQGVPDFPTSEESRRLLSFLNEGRQLEHQNQNSAAHPHIIRDQQLDAFTQHRHDPLSSSRSLSLQMHTNPFSSELAATIRRGANAGSGQMTYSSDRSGRENVDTDGGQSHSDFGTTLLHNLGNPSTSIHPNDSLLVALLQQRQQNEDSLRSQPSVTGSLQTPASANNNPPSVAALPRPEEKSPESLDNHDSNNNTKASSSISEEDGKPSAVKDSDDTSKSGSSISSCSSLLEGSATMRTKHRHKRLRQSE